jgi:hypothetical protein
MVKIKVFLASSSELEDERKDFEIFVNRKNKEWVSRGVFLELVVWEDFLDVLSKTRLQDEYDAEIRGCDLFVMLFWTKVGRYTEEEFDTAIGQFKAKDKPFVLVYFKDVPKPGGAASDADRGSLEAFQEKLDALGHYKTVYDNVDRLTAHFGAQLDKLAARGFISLDHEEEARRRRPFQAPPPDSDHVPREELQALKGMLIDENGALRSVTVGLHGFGGVGKTTLARLLCADDDLRRASRDGILWVPVGKNPTDLRGQIADLVAALVGDSQGCQTLNGARARLQSLLAGRRVLVVIDDLWDEAHARDLLQASLGCARLVTTRNILTLPTDAQLLDLAAMAAEQSRLVLGAGLPEGLEGRLEALAASLGRWPLLLRLVNRALRVRIKQRTPAATALDAVESELKRKGIRAFDPAGRVHERDQAVAATLDASLDMLAPEERERYAELAVFPQDVPISLEQVAELWRLTGGLDVDAATDLVTYRLDPLSLLEYDGAASTLRLHEVFRSYLAATLPDVAALHGALAASWGDRPSAHRRHAWRWLAFHRAAAIAGMPKAERKEAAQRLVALVGDAGWQSGHEAVLADLPALRDALVSALEAAVAVESPGGTAIVVEAAEALRRFDREHASAEPVLESARRGDLEGARRRSELYGLSIDNHWRQALILVAAWLAPAGGRETARALVADVERALGPEAQLHDLLAWVRADLHGDAPPEFEPSVPPGDATEPLVEQLVQRVGGGYYDRELIASFGLDPGAQNPDMPTRGLYLSASDGDAAETTTRYLAEADGPWLVAYAARDPQGGTAAFERYLSVYTNYGYAEYRHATLWLLLGHVLRMPRPDGGPWVRDTVVKIVGAALGGVSVEFEEGLAIAVRALRARAGDPAAREALVAEADRLVEAAWRMRPGQRREASDTWAHEKRKMLAHAQALGWLLGDHARAQRLLHEAQALAESGFAGFQAQACLALAEAAYVVEGGGRPAAIDAALESAQSAAHNVQDVSFCPRVTARVNAMRRHWWTPFAVEQRARQLGDGVPRREFAAVHRVGHDYPGRRADALRWPAWARDDRSLRSLARLYQRPKDDFLRMNGPDRTLSLGEEVAVPDRGLLPQLAARLAAEVLALAGDAPLSPDRAQLLRSLVPRAVASPTALDAVLQRLVLAEGRRSPAPGLAEIDKLEAVLAARGRAKPPDPGSELIAARLPA